MPKVFDPPDKPIDPIMWKPSPALCQLAKRRCDWINSAQLDSLTTPEEWLGAIVVGCYYQGLADGVKHMARKQRAKEKQQS